ncbi:MAG: molecular chaperone SurA [Methylococcales bacterium]|jgi:peptidyl-prolyl cis-trans isomerase SurA|nr:molecular chaperone SurA [Methylococcales bacterium]
MTRLLIKAVSFAALISCSLISPVSFADIEEIDEIIAIVNDDVIMRSEMDAKTREVIRNLQKKGASVPPQGLLQKQVLDRLILNRLQLEVAERAGIHVDNSTINRYIQRLAKNSGISVEKFQTILERDGYNFAAFRENLRKEITIRQVQNRQLASRLKVSDREVKRYLAKQAVSGGRSAFHLAHIYIASPEAASPDELNTLELKANGILAELRKGTDFSELAIAYSNSPQALEGGDLGWRAAEQVPSLFVDAASKLERDEVSEVLKAPSGFHIIKMLDYKGETKHVVSQIKAQHILIKTNDLVSDDDAITRLEQLRERIITGKEDFASLAQVHSDDKATSTKGGDLGWVGPGELVPAFEKELKALKDGEVSDIFRTPFGWHVLQVLGRRDHDSTDEVRLSQAKVALKKAKLEREKLLFLRRLRDEAYVEYQVDKY